MNPDNPWTYLYIGNLYYAKNNFPEAIEWFTEASKRIPDNGCPFWCLAEAYEKSGQWLLADKFFNKAVDVDPESEEAIIKLENWLDRNEPEYK